MGRYAEAEPLFRQALEMFTRGPDQVRVKSATKT